MASSYVNDLRLNEMATGDQSGTWGNTTNTNLELIAEAFGFGTEAITTNADTHTSTIADGATDPVRAHYVKYTGTLDSACTITIAPNTINRFHIIENATSGSQNIIISQGSGSNVTIAAGTAKAVYLDGAGSGAAVTDAFSHLSVVDLTVDDDLIVTDDISLKSDGAVINFGADSEVTLTHVHDTGLSLNDKLTITTTDNDDHLELISSDADASGGPALRFYRNSSSPADDDTMTTIRFEGNNDNSQVVVYNRMRSDISDASDGTEDGVFHIFNMMAGTERTMFSIKPDEVVFNEESRDVDFRVESDGEANMFFVDGGNDCVILGHSAEVTAVGSPESRLQAMAGGKQPSIDVLCFSDTTGHSGHLTFNKANSDTVGTMTAITDAHIVGRITAGGSDGTNFEEVAAIHFQADASIGNNDTPGAMVFYTTPDGDNSGTERMRISRDGQVRFVNGQVTIGGTSVLNSSELSITSPGSNNRVATFNCGGTSSNDQIVFQNGNGEVGTIRTSGSSTAYNTTSDYRLKENETSLNDGITRLKQLKPYYFNFKTEPNTKQEGFLAHEIQSVVPIAVSGEKDATKEITYEKVAEELYDDPTDTEKYRTVKTKQVMDTKTVIDPQQLDNSKLVPLLTAALQEAISKIETLETKVKALEEA